MGGRRTRVLCEPAHAPGRGPCWSVHATMALSRSLAKVKEFRIEKSAPGERAYNFGNQPRACREQEHPPFVIKRVVESREKRHV